MLLEVPGLSPAQCAVAARSRKFSQYKKMVEDLLAGRCPFCQIDPDRNPLIRANDHWVAWHCNPSEANTALHLLVVPRRHVTSMSELRDDPEGLALLRIMRELEVEFDITSSGWLCRDGDATLSAGTIPHLHWHRMVPDGTGRVESPFYKGAEAEAEGHLRAIVFEKMRTGTKLEDLTPEEQQRVEGRL